MLLGLLAAGLPLPARSAAPMLRKVGDIGVRVIDDGHMMVPLDRLAAGAIDDAAFRAILAADGISGSQHRFAVNVTLLEIGGKRILVDAGAGGTWVDTAGKLADSLKADDIEASSIDHVVVTHAHPDHLWGLIDDFDDTLRYPNATYMIPAREFDFWMSPTAPESARAAEGVTAGARRVLKRIEAKLTRVPVDAQVLPGLAYIDAAGHTPGQCAVLAASGSDKLLIAADTLFHPVISVRHPASRQAGICANRLVASRPLRIVHKT